MKSIMGSHLTKAAQLSNEWGPALRSGLSVTAIRQTAPEPPHRTVTPKIQIRAAECSKDCSWLRLLKKSEPLHISKRSFSQARPVAIIVSLGSIVLNYYFNNPDRHDFFNSLSHEPSLVIPVSTQFDNKPTNPHCASPFASRFENAVPNLQKSHQRFFRALR